MFILLQAHANILCYENKMHFKTSYMVVSMACARGIISFLQQSCKCTLFVHSITSVGCYLLQGALRLHCYRLEAEFFKCHSSSQIEKCMEFILMRCLYNVFMSLQCVFNSGLIFIHNRFDEPIILHQFVLLTYFFKWHRSWHQICIGLAKKMCHLLFIFLPIV